MKNAYLLIALSAILPSCYKGPLTPESIEVKISPLSPPTQILQLSTTAPTNDVPLLACFIKTNGPVSYYKIGVTVNTSIDMGVAVNRLKLSINGQTRDLIKPSGKSQVIAFFFSSRAGENDSLKVEIFADMRQIGTSLFPEGTTLQVSIDASQIEASDFEGESLNVLYVGQAVGGIQTFRSTKAQVKINQTSYSTTMDTSGLITSLTYSIHLRITASGQDFYIAKTAQYAAIPTGTHAAALGFNDSTAPNTLLVTIPTVWVVAASIDTIRTSDAITIGNAYRVDNGMTKNFTIIVTLQSLAATPAKVRNLRAVLNAFQTFSDQNLTIGSVIQSLHPTENYRTNYRPISSN